MINSSYFANSLTSQLARNIADIRQRIDTASNEAVNGRISDVAKHLGGNIGDAMLGQKALDDIERDTGLYKLREARLDLMQQSLARVQDGLSGLSARAINATSSPTDAEWTSISTDARSQLEASIAALSTRHGDRYLFSGDATSSRPLPDAESILAEIETLVDDAADGADLNARLDAFFDPASGRFANDLYRGTPTSSQENGITALDPAIVETLRGLSVLALSGPGGPVRSLRGSGEALNKAANGIASAEGQLTQLRANTGIQQEQVSNSLNGLEREKTILTGLFNAMTARDQYEAAAELKSLEANLEASYVLTARLSELTLMNFLR